MVTQEQQKQIKDIADNVRNVIRLFTQNKTEMTMDNVLKFQDDLVGALSSPEFPCFEKVIDLASVKPLPETGEINIAFTMPEYLLNEGHINPEEFMMVECLYINMGIRDTSEETKH